MASNAGSATQAREISIEWNPVNWFAATWRDNQPLEKLPPREFDTGKAKNEIDKYVINWLSAPCDLTLSTEEALFWFASCFGKGLGDFSILDELHSYVNAEKKIDLDVMKTLMSKTRFQTERAHGLVPIQILDTLMNSEDMIRLFAELPPMLPLHTQYRKYILPFLTAEKKQSVQNDLKRCLGKTTWDSSLNFPYYLAAALGLHDYTLNLVSSWSDTYSQRQDMKDKKLHLIVFGLGSAELVVEHFNRLGLFLTDHEQTISWIAHTEDQHLDMVMRSVQKAPFGVDESSMIKVIASIRSLKTAELMFDLYMNNPNYKTIAADWLQSNMRETVEALINISARESEKGDDALAHLRLIRNNLGDAVIRELASDMPPKAVKRLNDEILHPIGSELPILDDKSTPAWLSLAISAELKAHPIQKLPDWLQLNMLPPLVVNEHKLNPAQIAVVVSALQRSTLEAPSPLVMDLKTHGELKYLDKFSWLLFDTWLRNGGKAKDNWTMFAVAFLGSDLLALKLTRLIKVWPGESNHKRAVVGLDCLRVMGSDVALMQLNGIADKLKFKALKAKAEECMEAIAESRQMSKERLGDRIIPTLGFSRSGEREFDFGPRQFIVRVGAGFKPEVFDSSEKKRADLPAVGASDDAEKAKEALGEWKALKKGLKELQQVQTVRLEQSMVLGRRWFTDEYVNFLLHHPLMHFVLRDYVWGGFDMMGKLKETFSVHDKDKLENLDAQPVDISVFNEIGLLHPLQMSDDILKQWTKDFSTRKKKQLFPQLDRGVQRLAKNEENDFEILRLRNCRIPAVAIVSTLDKRGWQRGPVMEGGLFTEHLKYFPRADATAVVTYDGIPTGTGGVDFPDQYIEHCLFLPGKAAGEYAREFDKGIQLGNVDSIAVSEVLSDLELLKQKKNEY